MKIHKTTIQAKQKTKRSAIYRERTRVSEIERKQWLTYAYIHIYVRFLFVNLLVVVKYEPSVNSRRTSTEWVYTRIRLCESIARVSCFVCIMIVSVESSRWMRKKWTFLNIYLIETHFKNDRINAVLIDDGRHLLHFSRDIFLFKSFSVWNWPWYLKNVLRLCLIW